MCLDGQQYLSVTVGFLIPLRQRWTSAGDGSSAGVECGFVRRLKPTECHVYLDGQQYHCLKKNLNASRPSEHAPVRGGGEMSKRLGGIIEAAKIKPLHGI